MKCCSDTPTSLSGSVDNWRYNTMSDNKADSYNSDLKDTLELEDVPRIL
jgi:hypothetical protein